MGANQSTDYSLNNDNDFEIINFYEPQIINRTKISSPIISSPTQKYEIEEPPSLISTDIPDFKYENRKKRENKIHHKHSKNPHKFILKYNNYNTIDHEVEIHFNKIIHMRSFNELEKYLQKIISEYRQSILTSQTCSPY